MMLKVLINGVGVHTQRHTIFILVANAIFMILYAHLGSILIGILGT